MSWFDFFDAVFSGSSNSGARAGSFSQYALSEFAARVPYIGQYLGFYLTGLEDLSDLTNFPIDPIDADSGADRKRGKRNALEDFGIDGGSREKLISRSDMLADNTTPKVSVEAWLDAPRTPFLGQELVLDTGWSPRAPVVPAPPPQPEPIQEVFIRAPHPDRSKSPPLPSPPRRAPYRPPPESRPELQAPPRAETAPATQWTQEVVITAEPPFNPKVSDPKALAYVKGVGRIEWGDLVQLTRGGYNGLISAWQQMAQMALLAAKRGVLGPILEPILEPMLSPYAESLIREADKYRLSIDPRYGGAGIIGEQLAQNLAFELLPLVPQAASAARRALTSERMLEVLVSPVFGFTSTGGAGGGGGVGRVLARTRNAVPRYTEFASQFGKLERGELAHEQGAMLGDLMFHGQRQEALQQLRDQIGHIPTRPGKTPAGMGVNPQPGFQSSHTTPQSVFRNLPEYDPNEMITRFLSTGKGHAHTVFDKAWENEFALIHQQTGRTTTTAGELSEVVSRAARNSGAFSHAEAKSVSQLIINDLYFQLGLTSDTPLRMPGH